MAIESLGAGTWGNLNIGEQKKVVEMEIWKSDVLSKWQVSMVYSVVYSIVYSNVQCSQVQHSAVQHSTVQRSSSFTHLFRLI